MNKVAVIGGIGAVGFLGWYLYNQYTQQQAAAQAQPNTVAPPTQQANLPTCPGTACDLQLAPQGTIVATQPQTLLNPTDPTGIVVSNPIVTAPTVTGTVVAKPIPPPPASSFPAGVVVQKISTSISSTAKNNAAHFN